MAIELRLKQVYEKNIVPKLMEQFNFTSRMQVPKLLKICLNQGIGSQVADNKKVLEASIDEMTLITGQQAVATKAKKAISNFKLREGQIIGVKVTLRGVKMYEFLDRFISITLPRVRDFRGVNRKSFDGRGGYTLGITEQIIFPEVNIDKVVKINGMDITFVTSAKNKTEAMALLEELGMPFSN